MIKTISEDNRNEFENKINDLMDDGYKISSSSCGYIGEFETTYIIANIGWRFW